MDDLSRGDDLDWRKASSSATGNCVELARLADGTIAMRNSRDPDGPRLIYTRAEIAAFIDGAKAGEFDDLLASGDGGYVAVFIKPAADLAGTG